MPMILRTWVMKEAVMAIPYLNLGTPLWFQQGPDAPMRWLNGKKAHAQPFYKDRALLPHCLGQKRVVWEPG